MIRPLAADDAGAIVAFFAAAHSLDPVLGAVSAADWSAFVAAPQHRGGRDFRIAFEADAVAGVAMPSLRDHETPWIRHFRIVVAPERRRRGIGASLLRHIAEMDRPAPVFLQCLCPERWEGLAAFLEASGFAVLERELDMLCEEAGDRSARSFAIRRLDDPAPLAEALASIHNRAYAGTASFARLTGAEIAGLAGARALIFVAEQSGKPVGFCHVVPGQSESRIESVAVDPQRQGQGIGRALMARALAEAAARVGPRVRLSVSDRNAAAYALYRRLGFAVVATSTRYRADRAAVLDALGQRGR